MGELLELNGRLSLRGASGVGANAGGGSGGSLLIVTTNMTGHGLIAIDGGNASVNGSGGGGAGGRVAIKCRWRYQFGGRFDNFGGDGGAAVRGEHAGASGTTYREENRRELEYRLKKYDAERNATFLAVDHTYMHSDNVGKRSPAATLLMSPDRLAYELSELELTGTARLLLYHPPHAPTVSLTVHRFIGDRSGQVHLLARQVLYVEVVESGRSNRTEAPCSYIIDDGAEIVFPSETHVHGTESTIAGRVTGVKHLFIEDGALVQFLSSAQTALVENGSYVRITPPGNFTFDALTVKRGGVAGFGRLTSALSLHVAEFSVKYGGVLVMNEAEIVSSDVRIESTGVFRLDGKGRGEGVGVTRDGVGYGASHGGYGGMRAGDEESSLAEPYDSVYAPRRAGREGGTGGGTGGAGGAGGGVLSWRVGHHMELNGLLSLRGLAGTGKDVGGGSGGALLITATNFSGHGEINVEGGSGVGRGTGGSGGRIAIHCRWRYAYGGRLTNRGGTGAGVFRTAHAAAAGTAYIENNMRPLQYRHLKYATSTNETYFQVDHRFVHVDNEAKAVPVATMIMEERTTSYEFDEMLLTGQARLLFYHPPGAQVRILPPPAPSHMHLIN